MFNKKLKIFKNYFDENLAFDKIKHFIIDIDSFVLFVFKNNDNLKLYIDYKNLNIVFFKNKYSLSFINETFDRLINVTYFIKLNLKNAYYRIHIRENNEWKTIFRIKYNLFEYVIIFFDLINVSTIFQIFINKTLSELINQIYVVYLNDIFIYFKTKKKYWRNVCIVLKRLRKYNFYIKLTKCKFMIISIKFLNYIIFNHDMLMNSSKVFVIKKWFQSTNLKKLQIFFDFANFYKRFIRKYAKICKFLTKLLRNNKNEKQIKKFNFEKNVIYTFNELVITFTTILILIHFDFENKITIKTNVSKFVVTTILT